MQTSLEGPLNAMIRTSNSRGKKDCRTHTFSPRLLQANPSATSRCPVRPSRVWETKRGVLLEREDHALVPRRWTGSHSFCFVAPVLTEERSYRSIVTWRHIQGRQYSERAKNLWYELNHLLILHYLKDFFNVTERS